MTFQSFLPFEPNGDNTFTLTLEELIAEALDVLQIGVDGEGVEPEYYERARTKVNLVLLELQAMGLHISSYRTGFLFLQGGVERYIVEDSPSTNRYYQTALAADATSPTTTIVVDSASDMQEDDAIGVMKNDSEIFWTTIAGIAGTTITLADSLDGDADTGCEVFNYPEPLKKISRIEYILRRDFFTTDIPINQIGRQEYEALPFKNSTGGAPSEAYYHRVNPKGELFLWPPPADGQYIIRFWYEAKLDQLKDPTDALDMDQFYLPLVVKALALRLCNAFGLGSEMYQRTKAEYDEVLANTLSYDNEVTDISVSLNREAR